MEDVIFNNVTQMADKMIYTVYDTRKNSNNFVTGETLRNFAGKKRNT